MEKISGRIFKYVTDPRAPLHEHYARFAVRSNEESKVNELLFDAPFFFSFSRETDQIEKNITDEECVDSVAKGIKEYFLKKVNTIERHGSFKKVIFINLISWLQSREMIFSYLVRGTGKFSDFRTQVDKTITEDVYKKFEENFFERGMDDGYFSRLQESFNNFNEHDPVDAFYELVFMSVFIDSYCIYLFALMDPETMPGSLTEGEVEKFMGMLMEIFNYDFDKAFNSFVNGYYPSCLEEVKKIGSRF